jgi:hypothetical protein
MASDVSGTASYRAFLLHDPRVKTANLTANTAAGGITSDYTQASPFPGDVDDQNTTPSSMVLESSGVQSAKQELRLRIGQGGFPGTQQRGASAHWRDASEADWYGWDAYNCITGREWLEYIDNSLGTDDTSAPHIVRLDSNTAVLAYRVQTGGNHYTRIRTVTPGAAWVAAVDVQPSPAAFASADLNPCLLVMPSGRIHLYYWVKDTTAAVANVQMQYSDDDGATWAVGASACLSANVSQAASGAGSVGFDLGRIRAAVAGGQVLLVAHLTSRNSSATLVEVLGQWASDDDGVSFTNVETWTPDTTNGLSPSVLAANNGGFIVIHASDGSTGSGMYRLSSAYQAMTSAGTTTMGGLTSGSEAIDVFRDEDQSLYMAWFSTTDATQLVRSTDDGLTWTHLDDDSSNTQAFWHADDANTVLSNTDYTATALEGRMVVACKFSTATGTKDDESMLCLYGGGSSTHTLPSTSLFRRDSNQMAFNRTWTDIEKPGDCADWTKAGLGTDLLASTGLNLNTLAAQTLIYNDTGSNIGTTAVTERVVVLAQFDVQSGGLTTTDSIGFRVTLADGTDDYNVSIRCTTSQYQLYDANAASTVGSAQSVDMTAGVQIMLVLSDGAVAVFHRLVGTASDNARAWTDGPQSSSLTSDTGAPANNSSIEWGNLVTGSLTRDSNWQMFHWAVLGAGSQNMAAGFTNPDDLFGRPLSRFPIGIDDGVKVAALDGPGRIAETWNLDTAYQYAVDHLDHTVAPSPSRRWRSTDETQHDFVWDLTGQSAATRYLSKSMGIYLQGINWRTGSLWGSDAVGSWTKITDLDSAQGQSSLAYTRTGDCIHVNTGSSTDANRWWTFDSLGGATLDLGSSKFRKVARSGAGRWTDSTTQRPDIFIDGYDETEPASGTASCWSDRLLTVFHDATSYRRLRLRIDAQTTADGHFEIGTLMLGPVVVLGRAYDWGRDTGLTPNTALSTGEAGQRASRVRGPSRRSVTFAWGTGVDASSTSGTTPTPDYVTGKDSTEPVAAPADTAHLVEGLVDHLNGSHTPVVYVPKMDRTATVTLNQKRDAVYGRVMSSVRLQNAGVGDENESEVLRVLAMDFEEEV